METPTITDRLASPLNKITPSITDDGPLRERERKRERERERERAMEREREQARERDGVRRWVDEDKCRKGE